MTRIVLFILFTATQFLPLWAVSLMFLVILVASYILWKRKILILDKDILIIVPFLMLSYYIFPAFLFLLGAWSTLILFPIQKDILFQFKIIPESRYFASRNIFLILGLVVASYLAATIAYGTLFNLKRIPFSILYGFAVFSILWIYFKNMIKVPFALFFMTIVYPALFIISKFDLGFHPAIDLDLIIKGVFISAFFTMLFYLLDIIPKKMFLIFLGIQYGLTVIFGTRIFTLFLLYFIFQNLLVFSYGQRKEKPYDFIMTEQNRAHFFIPALIILLLLFVGPKYTQQIWPFLVASLLFSIYSLYNKGLWEGFIKAKLPSTPTWIIPVAHFLFYNSILLVFFIILKLLSIFSISSVLPLFISINILIGVRYYFLNNRETALQPTLSMEIILASIFNIFLLFVVQQVIRTVS